MEIDRPIKLDGKSIIEYFVEGITDTRPNKVNLYQASSIEVLKAEVLVYEKVRSGRQSKHISKQS